MEPVLESALKHALNYLHDLPNAPVGPRKGLEELRAGLDRPLSQKSCDPAQVIESLVKHCEGGLNNSAGDRFIDWVIGGAVPAALAADWLTSTWDQNSGMFTVAPAAAVVEEVVGKWLLDLLGLPASSSFALVTGCQMAHVTCLAAARNDVRVCITN